VCDQSTDIVGHVDGGQQNTFLVAGGTRAALLARKKQQTFPAGSLRGERQQRFQKLVSSVRRTL